MLELRMRIFAQEERPQTSDAERPQSIQLQNYLTKALVEACAVGAMGAISTTEWKQEKVRLKAE